MPSNYIKENNTFSIKKPGFLYKEKVKELKSGISSQLVTVENQHEMVSKAVTIFQNIPYNEQLCLKQSKNDAIVTRLKKNKKVTAQVLCGPSRILGTQNVTRYRSKDQFSILTDIQGNLTVGFFVGGRKDGTICVEPSSISIIRDDHKTAAFIYQNFIRESRLSPNLYLGEYSEECAKGYWGGITVKSNFKGELMVIIEFHECPSLKENLDDEIGKLVSVFEQSTIPLKSMFLAIKNGKNTKYQKLFGEKFIIEEILGIPILLGPDTFCQVNISGAETLLKIVKKKINSHKSKTLLDLCCGGGLFSLHLAPFFRGCIGVDKADTSVAHKSAKMNDLQNCTFINGFVQDVISDLSYDISKTGGGLSAILNPGRSGVKPQVIQEIRKLHMLDTLVYVSCQPEDAQVFTNMVDLMLPDIKGISKRNSSNPFTLIDAIPLDMFPLTHHCEHIFVFTR